MDILLVHGEIVEIMSAPTHQVVQLDSCSSVIG